VSNLAKEINMAQPAPAPQITPTATIKIKNGQADQQDVYILVGEEVEIHNTDNTPYQIPVTFTLPNSGSTSEFPLSIYLPAGGKLDLIGVQAATCQYWVNTAPSKGLKPTSGSYTIGVGSGNTGGGQK
jgi:hypothetical protein